MAVMDEKVLDNLRPIIPKQIICVINKHIELCSRESLC